MHVPEDIRREILELHELFQAWYQGMLPEADLASKIGVRLAEDFCITFPDGSVHTKADLLAMMQADWGNDSKYRIVIDDIQMQSSTAEVCQVTYTESQYWYGAEEANLVVHTVSSLRRSPDGWLWVSIHEATNDLFKDRKLVIATMHGKERVMAPVLERELGVRVVIPTGFDTDKYGTFARDIKRSGNQLEAARLKVRAAMEIAGADLGVASEGSFGAHPLIPFVQSDFELVVLIDAKNKYEICGHYRTPETNIDGQYISSVDEALVFAKKIGFPEHGIILKKEEDGRGWIDKKIRTQDELISAVTRRLSGFFTKKIFIETDMRADRNPTRMLAIEKATIDLIKNIRSKCPKCAAPGFVCIGFEKGLRCSLCGSPTDLPMADIFKCKTCSHEEKRPALGFESSADPKYCQYCNP